MAVLLIANAWRDGSISFAWFAAQKDALAGISSAVTAVVLVIGSVFSYFRFFRGRTLSQRAELSLSVSVHATTGACLIHAITLSAKNVGNTTIWNPLPTISAEVHGPADVQNAFHIADWNPEEVKSSNMAPVIDPGETVTFFALRQIAEAAWAVTYSAALMAGEGDTWHVAKTVSNKVPSKDGQ